MEVGFWFVGNRSALVANLTAGLDPQIRFYSRDAYNRGNHGQAE